MPASTTVTAKHPHTLAKTVWWERWGREGNRRDVVSVPGLEYDQRSGNGAGGTQ